MPSETLHRRDAVSEPPYNRSDGPTACYSPLPQIFIMQIKEGVKPHQKLIAAGMLIDAAMDGFTACSPLP